MGKEGNYVVAGAAALLAVSVAYYVFWVGGAKLDTATHSGSTEIGWELTPEEKDVEDRIYSGRRETVMLTVKVMNGAAEIEVLVNGSPINDGRLSERRAARTFVLFNVRTIDLRHRSGSAVTGYYKISSSS